MTGSDPGQIQNSDQTKLVRGLKSRHVELIAIGGAIGVGLFLGSAKAIQNAGPGLIIAYAIGGLAIFFIMRALGEMLLYRPVAGSFVVYADEFIGPFAGFATGWSYWFMWVVTGMAELTAVGVYVGYWLPDLPQWISVLAALIVLYGANMLAVRAFGEMEFWFALIKVAMIVMLIVGGLAVILFHVGDLGATAGFSNLWSHGGLLPFGILGVLLAFQMVMYGFQGVELIGVTAGEAENPEAVLPRATNSIIYRILLFYIGALVVIMSLIPWNQLDPRTSPFVLVFDRIGIPGAADIVNLVVITAALSSCNSGLFSTGRMLHALSQISQAPSALGAINRRHLPARAITVSAALMLVGVLLNFLVPDRVFIWVTSVALGDHHAGPLGLREGCPGVPGARRLFQDAGRALGELAGGGFPDLRGGPAFGRSGNARGTLCRAHVVRAARRRLRPDEAQTTTKHGSCCWTVAGATMMEKCEFSARMPDGSTN
jgi:AAT family amino acid transporter/D-serine/D-alanine/glycine transporter